jgi:threonine dehydrogenase-like Zn-dependent dehydrogenase
METEMQSPSSQLSHLAAPRPSPRYPPAALPYPILLCLSRARKAAPHLAARRCDRGPMACWESRHRSRATRGCPEVFSVVCAGGNGDKIPFEIPIHRTQEQILYAARPGVIGLQPGGTACLVGAVQELGRIDVEELRITQRTYTGTRGSLCCPDRDFPIFVCWYKRGQLDLDALVTQRYILDQINDAVADLSAGRIHGRSIITYE